MAPPAAAGERLPLEALLEEGAFLTARLRAAWGEAEMYGLTMARLVP
jgi:hypothetical protein